MNKPKIILVDMDGVLADFEGYFLKKWRENFPELPFIEVKDRREFYVSKEYPEEHTNKILQIFYSEGFCFNMEPIPGAIEAIQEIKKLGHEVFICSSPFEQAPDSLGDKLNWVSKYLDREWVTKLILINDKTLIHGDILIDDKPVITGVNQPTWKHVIYDQPYNKQNALAPRMDWGNWKEVLKDYLLV
jgi:5'-nucleotidase